MQTALSGERLNFIVALCAILISGASFYATYLQANSAEQQVKAMTWPLIEFSHGNYDIASKEKNLTLTVKNAGVGPAIIKTVDYRYRDTSYSSLNAFLAACCESSHARYMDEVRKSGFDADAWTMTTSAVEGVILPVGGQLDFVSLISRPENELLWQDLNRERWYLNLEICYCSLLENCYVTDAPGQIHEVESCGTRVKERL